MTVPSFLWIYSSACSFRAITLACLIASLRVANNLDARSAPVRRTAQRPLLGNTCCAFLIMLAPSCERCANVDFIRHPRRLLRVRQPATSSTRPLPKAAVSIGPFTVLFAMAGVRLCKTSPDDSFFDPCLRRVHGLWLNQLQYG